MNAAFNLVHDILWFGVIKINSIFLCIFFNFKFNKENNIS